MKKFLKSDKFYYSTSLIIVSMSLIFIGLLMIIGKDKLYFNIMNMFISIILILGVFQFIRFFLTKQHNKKITFFHSFSYLIFCLIISLIRTIPLSIFPLVFALYMLLNGLIRLCTYFLMLSNKANGRLIHLIISLIYFSIAIPLLFAPLKKVGTMLFLLGLYSLLLGFNYLIIFLKNILPIKFKVKMRRKFRITLPSILQAIIPYQVLKEINYYLNKETFDKPLILNTKKFDLKPDLEVFVHVAPSSYNRFGHVDICVDDKVISYGAYDFSTSKFFNMIGEGMIFVVNREKYINYCTKYSNKTLFCFGLKLTSKQKANVNKQIKSIIDNAYPYKTPYEIDKKNHCVKNEYTDYPSKLVKISKAKFYKVKSGQFKTFFILGTNCCRLANYIIGKGGIDLLKMTGIITPGAYYEYLNQEFYQKDSMVISRTIYNNQSIKN